MTVFIAVAVAMVAVALGFVLPGLLRPAAPRQDGGRSRPNALPQGDALAALRAQGVELEADLRAGTLEPDAYEAARRDLEHRALEHARQPIAPTHAVLTAPQRALAALIALGVVGLVAGGYRIVGHPAALDLGPRLQAAQADGLPGAVDDEGRAAQPTFPAASEAVTPAQIEAMVARLAARLQTRPEDPAGWRMLARSYETLGRFAQAAAAYEKLVKLAPPTPELLCDYAVTLAMSQGQTLAGPPEALIAQALQLDPDNIQALALAGSAAYERHDYAKAVVPWRRLLSLIPPDSEMARTIEGSIHKAESLASAKAAP